MLLLALITPILAASVVRRDVPAGWSYSNCYIDSTSSRSLSAAFYYDSAGMTPQSCISFCASKGYPVAGVEYSAECYCGAALPPQTGDGCNMPCSGDNTAMCGGSNRLSVYSTSSTVSTNPGPPGWTSQGCWTDQVGSRSLSYRVDVSALTVARCTSACSGYTYAGVEYSGECFCGNTLGGQLALSGCTMTCSGNSSEYCGGSDRLNVYQNNNAPRMTTASTTASTTTSSTTSTRATTTASSTAPAPTCAAQQAGFGEISNGGFESGFSGWSGSATGTVGQALLYRDAGTWEGCGVFVITPQSSGGVHQYILTSSTTIEPGSTKTLSFYVGRRSSAAARNNPSITAYIGISSGQSWTQTWQVCSGAGCTLTGSNGSVWTKFVGTNINSNARQRLSLQLTVNFGNGPFNADGSDDLLIDAVTVQRG